MKLLFCERNALMQHDLKEALIQLGISYRCASYVFSNPDSDDYYCSHLSQFLKEDAYDAVFSFNFIPVIADVCYELDVPYIVWNYDAGWEFNRTDALFYPTNHIFHFDKKACEVYKQMGYSNIVHMPLATNCKRLDAMPVTDMIRQQYTSKITFLGSLYEQFAKNTPDFFSTLHPDDSSDILQYIEQESMNYCHHSLWDHFTPSVVMQISSRSSMTQPLDPLTLITASASMIAGRQRSVLLNQIAKQFPLTLYSNSDAMLVPDADYRWRAMYYSQMPYIFRYATINLNLTIPSIQTGMPLRILDILGAGGFLLTNEQEELSDYFKTGTDLETFHNLEELMEKVNFFLNHQEAAARIAQNGHEIVKNDFSFKKQLHKMFTLCDLPLS